MSSQPSSSTLQLTFSKLYPLSAQTTNPALMLPEILDEIFSYIGPPHVLVQYRLVCKKWNDVIVHTLNTKWKNYFPLRLRYGPEVPLSLGQRNAERWARIILEYPRMTLTGSTIPLTFDTVVVDRDFYLAGVNPQWDKFLGIYGETIRHLKFNIRSGQHREGNSHHVSDSQVVSRENLRAAFSAMPNLESLDFSIRFTHYGTEDHGGISKHKMFPEAYQVTDLPQLEKLTKITIQEPHRIGYIPEFVKEILGMAPNLITLYIKCSKYLSTYASVLRALPHLDNSISTLGISMTDSSTRFAELQIHESGFSRFHLTKLELNGITGTGVYLEQFLQSQSSTLTTLILGDRVTPNMDPRSYHGPVFCPAEGLTTVILGTRRHICSPLYRNPLALPLTMDSLKVLEVNLPKFKLAPITNYQNQFPVLEELTFSKCEDTRCVWAYHHLQHLLPGLIGQSHTLKKFSLLGPMGDANRNIIIEAVRSTFPYAEHQFRL